jgi:hypothetical protein
LACGRPPSYRSTEGIQERCFNRWYIENGEIFLHGLSRSAPRVFLANLKFNPIPVAQFRSDIGSNGPYMVQSSRRRLTLANRFRQFQASNPPRTFLHYYFKARFHVRTMQYYLKMSSASSTRAMSRVRVRLQSLSREYLSKDGTGLREAELQPFPGR